MRNIGLSILLCVAALSVYACSTANKGNLPNPTNDDRKTFSIQVDEGLGSFTPELVVEETSSGVAVTIMATDAEELAAANFNLHYDSNKFSPDRVEITNLLGFEEQVISMSVLDQADLVAVGVAQIHNRGGVPVNGSGDLATVYFNHGPADVVRRASSAPVGIVNEVELFIIEQTDDEVTLLWTEKNVGDYNNNSEVGVSDLTPIALLYGETNPTPHQMLVDGDNNGEVGLSDITQIALNFGNTVKGYTIYGDGTGSNNVGSGMTCDRALFFINEKTPVEYVFSTAYDPFQPALFTVRPVDNAEAVSPGKVSTVAEPLFEEGAPQVPTDVVATGNTMVGSGNISLTWTKSAFVNAYDVGAYEIQRSDAGSGTWEAIGEVGGSGNSYLDMGLADQGYDYQVRARDLTALTSDWSATGTATPWFEALPDPPGPPTGVTATPHASIGQAVQLNWTAPVDGIVVRYLIFSQEEGGAGFVKIGTTQFATTKSFTHSGLTPGINYEFYVVTVGDGFVESVPSDIASSMCSEEGEIEIISLTTDKKTHFANGGDASAATITVVADPAPDTVVWEVSPTGSVTGTGSSVTYKPGAGTAPGVVTITCTVGKGSGEAVGTIEMYLTEQTIKNTLGVAGQYIDFTGFPSNIVPDAPFRPFNYYMQGDTAVLLNLWGIW